MSKTEYKELHFRITHTIEDYGPHPTIPYDFYEDTFLITILISGSGMCYIEGNNYVISDGDIIVMSPDDIHSFKFTQDGYHERISIYLSGDMLLGFEQYQLSLMELFKTSSAKSKYIYSSKDCNEVVFAPLINQLREIVEDSDLTMQHARIHILILQLLFMLYDSKTKESYKLKSNTQNSVFSEICIYIKEHLKEKLSYEELQKHFHATRYQLAKHFQQNIGMTLMEYILHKRLMNVISLVRNGEGIESAVYNSGFNTYSHFYKEFKKHFNVSPKAYFCDNHK